MLARAHFPPSSPAYTAKRGTRGPAPTGSRGSDCNPADTAAAPPRSSARHRLKSARPSSCQNLRSPSAARCSPPETDRPDSLLGPETVESPTAPASDFPPPAAASPPDRPSAPVRSAASSPRLKVFAAATCSHRRSPLFPAYASSMFRPRIPPTHLAPRPQPFRGLFFEFLHAGLTVISLFCRRNFSAGMFCHPRFPLKMSKAPLWTTLWRL